MLLPLSSFIGKDKNINKKNKKKKRKYRIEEILPPGTISNQSISFMQCPESVSWEKACMSPERLSGRSCTVDFRSQLSMSTPSTRLCAAERIRGENGDGVGDTTRGDAKLVGRLDNKRRDGDAVNFVTTVMMSSSVK